MQKFYRGRTLAFEEQFLDCLDRNESRVCTSLQPVESKNPKKVELIECSSTATPETSVCTEPALSAECDGTISKRQCVIEG